MTKDEIIELAVKVWFDGYMYIGPSIYSLERFANLVAAKERERCAMVCEELASNYGEYGWVEAASNCAEAIRSLK